VGVVVINDVFVNTVSGVVSGVSNMAHLLRARDKGFRQQKLLLKFLGWAS
jgi:hypothetical protein